MSRIPSVGHTVSGAKLVDPDVDLPAAGDVVLRPVVVLAKLELAACD